MIEPQAIWTDVQAIREQAPLVHNITNYVVMNNTANALLSLGASPVMAHAEEEIADMLAISSALVINIGTLSGPWINSMRTAISLASERHLPIVLDPVGAGATRFRTRTMQELLSTGQPTVLRGNASEIMALELAEAGAKGVDSRHSSDVAVDIGRHLATQLDCTVCISGATDWILTHTDSVQVFNGHPLMPRVTGLGCTASALIGAFCAVNSSPSAATAHAMAVMGIAGEIAGEQAAGPGTFQLHFLDALHLLSEADIIQRANLSSKG